MNNRQPLISVIIPVYNVEEYLDECIASVVTQTWCELEVLLIDDGSTDQSGVICDTWKERDRRVKVFHCDNKGVSAARNYGLINCKGEYISFLDSDDFLDRQTIEKLYLSISRTQGDISTCGTTWLYYDGTKWVSNTPSCEKMPLQTFVTGVYAWKNQYAWG